jgi:hypothetical protein
LASVSSNNPPTVAQVAKVFCAARATIYQRSQWFRMSGWLHNDSALFSDQLQALGPAWPKAKRLELIAAARFLDIMQLSLCTGRACATMRL